MSTPALSSPRVSVVVPVMNEEESAPDLAAEVTEALDGAGLSWECVWVNDGSTDRTLDVLVAKAVERWPGKHRVLDLDRNYGQSAALAAGFRHARGEILATLDGDGQNDPHDIPRLIEALDAQGVDMVNGVRARRRDSAVRRISSRLANGFRNWLTRESVSDVGCAIRVFRRQCVQDILVFKGMHRFLPTLARLQGARIAEMPVNHRPRTRGQTKYGISNRLWVGLADVFAVRWMQWRMVRPRVRAEFGGVD
ncbi:MAG: glycosyltransferase family 2 protein [Kiritimatiellaeota bacterium]|nr:glycosyltransferase family 2 protein [Kiritimatiellota bacterium]